MDLIYGIKDKPKFGKIVLFALQQLLAIMAATIAVPAILGHGLSASVALFGAGAGTIIYLLFTKSSSLFSWEAHSPSSVQCSVLFLAPQHSVLQKQPATGDL